MYKKMALLAPFFMFYGALAVNGGALIKINKAPEMGTYIGKGTIVVVYVGSVTCGPCKMFHPVLEQLAQDNPDVIFLDVTYGVVPDCQLVMSKYAIRSFPTFIFFDAQGNKIDSFSGGGDRTKGKIEAVIAKIKAGMAKPMAAPVTQPVAVQPSAPVASASCKPGVVITYPQKEASVPKQAAMQGQKQTTMKVKKGRRPRQK